MAYYYLKVPVEEKQGYWTIEFSQGAPNYVGTLIFVETGGSGETKVILNYTSLVANLDGSYTCTDTDGNTHLIVPTYDSNNVVTSITYDGDNISIVYDSNGALQKIGDSDVNTGNYEGELDEVDNILSQLVTLS